MFESLPSELMQVSNLKNREYVEVVLDGSLENLPRKFAEAARTGASYATWRLGGFPSVSSAVPASWTISATSMTSNAAK